jgi:hypothetical protein
MRFETRTADSETPGTGTGGKKRVQKRQEITGKRPVKLSKKTAGEKSTKIPNKTKFKYKNKKA